MGRAPCCDKAIVKRGPWSPEEDAVLKGYIEEHGTGGNWIALPHKIGLKRCGKSCRLRWLNYLRPNIKHGGFSEEEDNIICNLYISIGSRWSIIAAQLPGRTDNDIKNYWNTSLKKKLLGRRKDSRRTSSASSAFSPSAHEDKDGQGGMNSEDTFSQTFSASAIERMQLQMQLQGPNNPFSNFYNNPALWPKLHPLAETLGLQTPQSGAQRFPLGTTLPEPSSNIPLVPRNINGDFDADSLDGFPSASKPAAVVSEKINKNTQSKSEGLQDELIPLIHGKNATDGAQGGQQQQQQQQPVCHEPDWFREMDADQENLMWWSDNWFGDKSSCSSWESASVDLQPDSIFQDYMLGYDIW